MTEPTIHGHLDRVTGKPASIFTPPEDLVPDATSREHDDAATIAALRAEVAEFRDANEQATASLADTEDALRAAGAVLARVVVLPDEWEGEADANETHPKECRTLLSAAAQLRAALTAPADEVTR